MSTESKDLLPIAVQQTGLAKIVGSMEDLTKLGELIAKSGVCGGDVTASAGVVVAMTCMNDGITPIEFNRKYHLIGGRPSMRADAMLGLLIMTGGKYVIKQSDEKVCEIEFTRGENKVPVRITMEECVASGITKNGEKTKKNWQSFPAQMLFARVTSRGVRMVAPDIVSGMYTPEEMQDITTEANVVAEPLTKEQVAERMRTQKDASAPNVGVPVVDPEVLGGTPAAGATTKKRSEKTATKKQEPKPEDADIVPPVAQTPTPETAPANPASAPVDFSLVPAGKFAGQKWDWIEPELMAKALDAAKVPEGCKTYIRDTVCAVRGWQIAKDENGNTVILAGNPTEGSGEGE